MRPHPRRLVVATALLALAVAGTACGSEPETKAEKSGTGELRRQLSPLTKRFDVLGSPRSAAWMSGTLGERDSPGPSTYWIDAVVTLAPGQARALGSRFGATKADARPDVVGALRAKVPQQGLRASDALDAAFSQGGFVTKAFLNVESNRVVLTSRGQ